MIFVKVGDTPQCLRVLLRSVVYLQLYLRIGQDSLGHPPLQFDGLELEVLLGPDNEESADGVDSKKLFEEVVTMAEDVVCSCFKLYLRHHLHIVHRSRCDVCDVKEGRHLGLDVVQSMDFYTALIPTERSPGEHCKAKVDGCRVEGIDVPAKVEDLLNFQSTSLFNEMVCILFEDMIVPVLVRFSKIASCDRLAEAEVVSLAAVSLNRDDQVPQALSSGKLTEHKNEQLIPTGKALHIAVSQILRDDIIELILVKKGN